MDNIYTVQSSTLHIPKVPALHFSRTLSVMFLARALCLHFTYFVFMIDLSQKETCM